MGTRRYVLLVFLLVSLSPVSAQEVPLSGRYVLSGELVEGPARDRASVDAYVNECGDEIEIYHPELLEPLVLTYESGRYEGSGRMRQGTLEGRLRAPSDRRLTGTLIARSHRAPLYPVHWRVEFTFSGSSEAAPPRAMSGYGGTTATESSVERQGVFVEERTEYRVALINFPPNGSTLAPQHARELDRALKRMMEAESGIPGRSCESVESNWSGPAAGFADRKLEQRNREALKISRAKALHDYVAPRFRAMWNGSLIGGGPGYEAGADAGAPGTSGSCPRAAIAPFEVRREYADLYSKEEADEWLADWLGEKGVADRSLADRLFGGKENEDLRRRAKGAYCMARGFRRMLQDGHCEPPKHSPAERALKGRRMSMSDADPQWRAYGTVKDELKRSYDEVYDKANDELSQEGGSGSLSGMSPEGVRTEAQRRERTWYRYAFDCPDDVKSEADRMEERVYGDVTTWTTWEVFSDGR